MMVHRRIMRPNTSDAPPSHLREDMDMRAKVRQAIGPCARSCRLFWHLRWWMEGVFDKDGLNRSIIMVCGV